MSAGAATEMSGSGHADERQRAGGDEREFSGTDGRERSAMDGRSTPPGAADGHEGEGARMTGSPALHGSRDGLARAVRMAQVAPVIAGDVNRPRVRRVAPHRPLRPAPGEPGHPEDAAGRETMPRVSVAPGAITVARPGPAGRAVSLSVSPRMPAGGMFARPAPSRPAPKRSMPRRPARNRSVPDRPARNRGAPKRPAPERSARFGGRAA